MLLLKLLKACTVPVRFTMEAVDTMGVRAQTTAVVKVESWVSVPCGPGPAVAQPSLMLDCAVPRLFCKSRLLEVLLIEDNYICAVCVARPRTQVYFQTELLQDGNACLSFLLLYKDTFVSSPRNGVWLNKPGICF